MTLTSSNLFSALPVIDVMVGKPSVPNSVGEALVRTYQEGVHEYPLYRANITVTGISGISISLGNDKQPLDLSFADAIETLQPDVQRHLPGQKPAFIPAFGVLGAHHTYVSAMKWALDSFNRANRPHYEAEKIQPLVGGMLTGETTFYLFAEHVHEANLEYLKIPLHQDENWAVRAQHLKATLAKAHQDRIFPLGLTSISPDAPVHNIRDRETALALYQTLQSLNDQRMAWLIRQSGGQQRFDELKKSNPDFAEAIAILARPKLFDDLVYLPTEAGNKRTCLFAELHDEIPHIVEDIVTGISLSKIGLAGLRSGAVFVFNRALSKRMSKIFTLSVEGMNFSSFAPLALLDKRHPKNTAFRQSILDYRDDLYQRAAYFFALFQSNAAGDTLIKALPKLGRLLGSAIDPITQQPVTLGAIPGVALLPREAAGYFANIHIDTKIWTPVLDAAYPTRRADGITDIEAMHRLLPEELKIMVMPIALKDRDGKPMAVFRMNCHTPFENLTGVVARLRHVAQSHGLSPTPALPLNNIPAVLPARPPLEQDNAPPAAARLATDVA